MDRRRIALRSALSAALLTLVLATLMLAGCALWEEPQAFAYAGQAADLATMGAALCTSDNYVEANPILTLGGEDCWQVMASGVLLKAGMLAGLRALCRPSECPAAWRIVGGMGFGAAAWNAGKMAEE